MASPAAHVFHAPWMMDKVPGIRGYADSAASAVVLIPCLSDSHAPA
ncbi:hypothetical protein LV478_05450 [Komagataeibacter oboediens]|nr:MULTISPECIES: hypothetical protein [Komagataeibacter]MBV1822701.1 hypothetical protein [Komagataeibacter oboediens]WEQ52982.1 hypothetical protein LV478_05450 [Komagataeibacter oboediens]GCE80782.1 hypothetical protein MSKU3_2257 [Komagataeibacter oboediens]